MPTSNTVTTGRAAVRQHAREAFEASKAAGGSDLDAVRAYEETLALEDEYAGQLTGTTERAAGPGEAFAGWHKLAHEGELSAAHLADLRDDQIDALSDALNIDVRQHAANLDGWRTGQAETDEQPTPLLSSPGAALKSWVRAVESGELAPADVAGLSLDDLDAMEEAIEERLGRPVDLLNEALANDDWRAKEPARFAARQQESAARVADQRAAADPEANENAIHDSDVRQLLNRLPGMSDREITEAAKRLGLDATELKRRRDEEITRRTGPNARPSTG